MIDADLERSQSSLAELFPDPLTTMSYPDFTKAMRPFNGGFGLLSTEEKHKLVAERFSEIRVKDYQVISLFLLTGVRDYPEELGSECLCNRCHRHLRDFAINYDGPMHCEECVDWMAAENQAAKEGRLGHAESMAQTVVPHLARVPLRTLRDSSLGL